MEVKFVEWLSLLEEGFEKRNFYEKVIGHIFHIEKHIDVDRYTPRCDIFSIFFVRTEMTLFYIFLSFYCCTGVLFKRNNVLLIVKGIVNEKLTFWKLFLQRQ